MLAFAQHELPYGLTAFLEEKIEQIDAERRTLARLSGLILLVDAGQPLGACQYQDDRYTVFPRQLRCSHMFIPSEEARTALFITP